jgi:hypothetical protein
MNKNRMKNLLVVGLLIVVVGLIWFTFNNQQDAGPTIDAENNNHGPDPADGAPVEEDNEMDLVVFLQDKEAAITSDCRITIAETIQVPATKAVADASLTYLFNNELAQYGEYESVVIKDEVAQVTIINEDDPTGLKISSLSSCQIGHLVAVLSDTLTQYDTITAVELHSPSGLIEF